MKKVKAIKIPKSDIIESRDVTISLDHASKIISLVLTDTSSIQITVRDDDIIIPDTTSQDVDILIEMLTRIKPYLKG